MNFALKSRVQTHSCSNFDAKLIAIKEIHRKSKKEERLSKYVGECIVVNMSNKRSSLQRLKSTKILGTVPTTKFDLVGYFVIHATIRMESLFFIESRKQLALECHKILSRHSLISCSLYSASTESLINYKQSAQDGLHISIQEIFIVHRAIKQTRPQRISA